MNSKLQITISLLENLNIYQKTTSEEPPSHTQPQMGKMKCSVTRKQTDPEIG
jgi:hypothetical protein